MTPFVSQSMQRLKDDYGFDTVGEREHCVALAEAFPGASVLDMGTGSGWMAIIAARMGLRVVSMDVSREAIRRAGERLGEVSAEARGRITFCVADGLRLPFSDDTFDAVLTFDAIHHLPNSSCLSAVREMVRVIKPNGRAVLSDLNERGMQAVNEVISRSGEQHECNRCVPGRVAQLLTHLGLRFQAREREFITAYALEKPGTGAAYGAAASVQVGFGDGGTLSLMDHFEC